MQPEFVRLKTISTMSGLSTKTLRRYIKSNLLQAVKIGGNYYVFFAAYHKFLIDLQLLSKGIKKEKIDELAETLRKEIQKEENENFSKMCKSFGMSDEEAAKLKDMRSALGLR